MDNDLKEKVVKSDVSGLHEMLMNKEVTSVQLVNIFGERCYTHGRRLCLLTEEFYEIALADAQAKDQQRLQFIDQGR